ncbi:DUF134 domain-containing protein [Saccharicrinis sp. FJH54]|uniref:DUF134 domain-containing protein n=1 Tax=Saccharicrinis sp. FJH54 TaxID=3344665 RepID=UPI0035D4A539
MSRPKRLRKISNPPRIKGMNPFGYYGILKDPVQLFHEEYECIRLLDYEGMTQSDASELMEVSRPTLTRIYDSARRKIATAFTEARQLKIEGGQAIFADHWYECIDCKSRFNQPVNLTTVSCPVCNADNVYNLSIE